MSFIEANIIAAFTNLKAIALEIVQGAGVDHDTVIEFIEEIDSQYADSEFTDKLKELAARL